MRFRFNHNLTNPHLRKIKLLDISNCDCGSADERDINHLLVRSKYNRNKDTFLKELSANVRFPCSAENIVDPEALQSICKLIRIKKDGIEKNIIYKAERLRIFYINFYKLTLYTISHHYTHKH